MQWISVDDEPLPDDLYLIDYVNTPSGGKIKVNPPIDAFAKDTLNYHFSEATHWKKKQQPASVVIKKSPSVSPIKKKKK
jgi:hypothetical protein